MAKGITFEPQFETILSGKGRIRGESLKTTPIGQIFSNTTDRKNLAKLLTKAGLEKYTINDIFGKNTRKFVEELVYTKKLTNAQKKDLIGPFKPLLAEVGISAQGTTNPLRSHMTNVVGDSVMKAQGFGTDPLRLIPANYPSQAYQALKNLAAKYNAAGRQEEKTFLLTLMFGGYRPSDFKNIKFENIDFETGLVQDVKLKTDTAGSINLAYMPEAQRDIIKSYMESTGRTKGLVFQNINSLVDNINEDLTKTNVNINYLVQSKKELESRPMSIYDLRRIKESDYTAAGYDPNSYIRKLATWRPKKGNVEQYIAGVTVGGQIEDANAKAFSPYVLLTEGNLTQDGTKNPAQFLEDVGVKTTEYTQQYMTTKKSFKSLPPFKQKEVVKFFPNVAYPDEVDGMSISDPQDIKTLSPENAKLIQEKAGFDLQKGLAQSGSEALAAKQQYLTDLQQAGDVDEQISAEQDKQAAQKKQSKLNQALEKGKKVLDWAGNNLNTITYALTGLSAVSMTQEAISDFRKYKQEGYGDITAGIGAGAETVRDIAVAGGRKAVTMLPDMIFRPTQDMEGGSLSGVVRDTARTQAGQEIPSRQMGMESESTDFLNQMQSSFQPSEEGASQALNIIEEDTNIGDRMSTFGRTPDVSPGFVTPPSRSELADETQRQQNFMGVT
jgi:integrase